MTEEADRDPPRDGRDRQQAPADPDDPGSSRMLLAAAMLASGDDIDQVAVVSVVPAALLHLMSDELSAKGRVHLFAGRPGRR